MPCVVQIRGGEGGEGRGGGRGGEGRGNVEVQFVCMVLANVLS